MFDHVCGVEEGHSRRYRLSVRDLFLAGVVLGYPWVFRGIFVTFGSGRWEELPAIYDIPGIFIYMVCQQPGMVLCCQGYLDPNEPWVKQSEELEPKSRESLIHRSS